MTYIAEATRKPGRIGEAVLHFTPNWFAASMGTGILSVALGQFPQQPLLHLAGVGLFLFNIALFSTFLVLYALKWLLHTEHAVRIFSHPVQSMFLGTIPMALATLANGTLLFGPELMESATVAALAFRLWMVDAALAVAIGIGVPFLMFTRQSHTIADMSAVWLLPVVAAEVAAATGGLLLPHVSDASTQLGILMTTLVLWSLSVPVALGILVILFLRMALHKLPPAAMAATSWLALGPIGTGALGLTLIALNGGPALAASGMGNLADPVSGAALLGALLLWGYGLWWLGTALLITIRQIIKGMPFNLGWWAYTFPLGVYAVATLKIGVVVPFSLFNTGGAILVGVLSSIWLIVASRTLSGAIKGRLFSDPCVMPRE